MSSIVEFRTVLGNCGISRYWDDFLAFERNPSELAISFLRLIDRFVQFAILSIRSTVYMEVVEIERNKYILTGFLIFTLLCD